MFMAHWKLEFNLWIWVYFYSLISRIWETLSCQIVDLLTMATATAAVVVVVEPDFEWRRKRWGKKIAVGQCQMIRFRNASYFNWCESDIQRRKAKNNKNTRNRNRNRKIHKSSAIRKTRRWETENETRSLFNSSFSHFCWPNLMIDSESESGRNEVFVLISSCFCDWRASRYITDLFRATTSKTIGYDRITESLIWFLQRYASSRLESMM